MMLKSPNSEWRESREAKGNGLLPRPPPVNPYSGILVSAMQHANEELMRGKGSENNQQPTGIVVLPTVAANVGTPRGEQQMTSQENNAKSSRYAYTSGEVRWASNVPPPRPVTVDLVGSSDTTEPFLQYPLHNGPNSYSRPVATERTLAFLRDASNTHRASSARPFTNDTIRSTTSYSNSARSTAKSQSFGAKAILHELAASKLLPADFNRTSDGSNLWRCGSMKESFAGSRTSHHSQDNLAHRIASTLLSPTSADPTSKDGNHKSFTAFGSNGVVNPVLIQPKRLNSKGATIPENVSKLQLRIVNNSVVPEESRFRGAIIDEEQIVWERGIVAQHHELFEVLERQREARNEMFYAAQKLKSGYSQESNAISHSNVRKDKRESVHKPMRNSRKSRKSPTPKVGRKRIVLGDHQPIPPAEHSHAHPRLLSATPMKFGSEFSPLMSSLNSLLAASNKGGCDPTLGIVDRSEEALNRLPPRMGPPRPPSSKDKCERKPIAALFVSRGNSQPAPPRFTTNTIQLDCPAASEDSGSTSPRFAPHHQSHFESHRVAFGVTLWKSNGTPQTTEPVKCPEPSEELERAIFERVAAPQKPQVLERVVAIHFKPVPPPRPPLKGASPPTISPPAAGGLDLAPKDIAVGGKTLHLYEGKLPPYIPKSPSLSY